VPYKKTSSYIDRLRARLRTRGAVFLEALVVISALTLGLIALVYVRDLYVKEFGAARLARASVLAHSMAGCKSNEPNDWLGSDAAGYKAGGASQDQQSAHGKDESAAGSTPTQANGPLERSGSTSADGQGLLNPIAETEFTGHADASERNGGSETRAHVVFSGTVRAKSYVSCGDEVKDGDFDRVMGVMKDEISTLLGK